MAWQGFYRMVGDLSGLWIVERGRLVSAGSREGSPICTPSSLHLVSHALSSLTSLASDLLHRAILGRSAMGRYWMIRKRIDSGYRPTNGPRAADPALGFEGFKTDVHDVAPVLDEPAFAGASGAQEFIEV